MKWEKLLLPAVLACPLAATAVIMLDAPQLYAADAGALRAGAAKADITPKDLTGIVSVWAKPFDGVHDPIYARALVLDNGTTTAALVALDLVEYGDTTPVRERIAHESGIPVDHIIVCASHDHNAPRGGPITPGSSSAEGRPYSPPAYTQFIDDQIVEAVRKAKASMQPARFGIGTGRADINENRNAFNGKGWGGPDPDGPSDKTVWVVKFESLSGDPIAILMNYAVHSIVAGPLNTLVTGDLAGAAERFVERHYGDKAVALWTMGPAGDQNPFYNMSVAEQGMDKDPAKDKALAYEAMDALGLVVGEEAIQTADRISQMTPTVRMEAAEQVFSCDTVPQRPRPAGAPSPFPANPNFKENIPYPASMKIHLNLIELNQVAITGVSGEVFTNIYWHLKKDSPLSDTFMVTMSNDRIGYIGDDASYDGPFRNASVVRGCAENGIVNGLVGMIGANQ